MSCIRTRVQKVLTRTGGYLLGTCSHSLQPYRGCTYGRTACGLGCYAQHLAWVTRGRSWGSFLEIRENAADSYRRQVETERRWARRARGGFGIFLSTATDPFVPQERSEGVTHSVLLAMIESPPDELVVQTHSPLVLTRLDELRELSRSCELRVHLSIESDRDRLPGLPPPVASVEERLEAAAACRAAGLRTLVTVAPLWPIADPETFFGRLAEACDGVVLDHFVGGDGTPDGRRTRRTGLPAATAAVDPSALEAGYLERMARVARKRLPGRVGLGAEGFAGRLS